MLIIWKCAVMIRFFVCGICQDRYGVGSHVGVLDKITKVGSNYVQEREAIWRTESLLLDTRVPNMHSWCHSQVVTKAMHGVKGYTWC